MLLKNLTRISNENLQKLLNGVISNKNLIQARNASAFKFVPDTAPPNLGETTKMNLCQSITNALDLTLSTDKSAGKER
jgi:hypothetical protein